MNMQTMEPNGNVLASKKFTMNIILDPKLMALRDIEANLDAHAATLHSNKEMENHINNMIQDTVREHVDKTIQFSLLREKGTSEFFMDGQEDSVGIKKTETVTVVAKEIVPETYLAFNPYAQCDTLNLTSTVPSVYSYTPTTCGTNNFYTDQEIRIHYPVRLEYGSTVLDSYLTYDNYVAVTPHFNGNVIVRNVAMDSGTGTNMIKYHLSYPSMQTEAERAQYAQIQRRNTLQALVRENLEQKVRARTALPAIITTQEQTARDTLRDMLSEAEWRRYCTNGFLMVRGSKQPDGSSAYWYQIFNNGSRTRVYQDNRHVATLCVHTHAECPPTDHVINLKILAELDEKNLWDSANVTWQKNVYVSVDPGVEQQGNLLERMSRINLAWSA